MGDFLPRFVGDPSAREYDEVSFAWRRQVGRTIGRVSGSMPRFADGRADGHAGQLYRRIGADLMREPFP